MCVLCWAVFVAQVLHGSDSDILWLQRDLGLYVVNMFDTGQVVHPSYRTDTVTVVFLCVQRRVKLLMLTVHYWYHSGNPRIRPSFDTMTDSFFT